MPLVNITEILWDAKKRRYGVPAFNVFNFETIKWAVEAAEDAKAPVIIQFYPGYCRYIPLSVVSAAAKDLAESSSQPVAVHLDHSVSFEQAVSGIRYGFPSVMVDGSALPYEQNRDLTAEVVKTAKAMGVEVEGELGHVGSAEKLDDFKNPNNFTPVEEAVRFVAETGVDTLAVSVGNGHGHYVATPQLDYERMAALRDALPVPLVMHGCSDIPGDQMRKAVELGFCKFNIATEYFRAYNRELYQGVDEATLSHESALDTMECVSGPVKAFVRSKIKLLNPCAL